MTADPIALVIIPGDDGSRLVMAWDPDELDRFLAAMADRPSTARPPITAAHGTTYRYKDYGCRCEPCRRAHRLRRSVTP